MRHAYKAFRTGPVTVFEIMRDRELREAYEARLSAPAETVVPVPREGDDLSTMQKLALLQMMNSTLARGVATKLRSNEGIQAKPSIVDYHVLRERGLAEKLDGEQFHELTYQGSKLAEKVLSNLCADLDVHIMQPGQVDGQGRDQRTYYRCSCGGWGRSFRGNGQFAWRKAANDFHAHYNPLARGVEG